MKLATILLCLSTCTARDFPKVKLTSYDLKYYGRLTATRDTLRRTDLSCAVNRDNLKRKTIWVRAWVSNIGEAGYRIAAFKANDVFHRSKFSAPFVKLDLTQEGYRSLGIEHTRFAELLFAEDRIGGGVWR